MSGSFGYKRRWRCTYCRWEWRSVLNMMGARCPECGSEHVKATGAVASIGVVRRSGIKDPGFRLGQALLMEAQK